MKVQIAQNNTPFVEVALNSLELGAEFTVESHVAAKAPIKRRGQGMMPGVPAQNVTTRYRVEGFGKTYFTADEDGAGVHRAYLVEIERVSVDA